MAFERIGYNVFAEFREKIISEIPTNIGMPKKEERIEFVKGADFKKANLKFADIVNAFLVKTDLMYSKPMFANFKLIALVFITLSLRVLEVHLL